MRSLTTVLLTLAAFLLGQQSLLAADERRLALVIGNADYEAGGLPTAANDAGLVAQTLQAAGFDVVGARDLDGDSLRRTFRDFSDKVSTAGPDAVVMVYLAGYGLQFEGDNYFAGVDARIERDIDVPSNALKISDFLRPLAASRPRSLVVVLDAARDTPFAKSGNPLAGGLALMESAPGMLVAFNAAPGTLAPPESGEYGVYARALAEMIREGGLPLNILFDRVRLRVNAETDGGSVPWDAGRIDNGFVYFERGPDAPRLEASVVASERRLARRIRDFDAVEDAYFAALERDTLGGYVEFLDAYSDSRYAKRVRAIVAARREALTWRRTRAADTPNAYWTYLDIYPEGPHAWDARRRLNYLAAAYDPPSGYTRFIYDDLPPPPAEELFFMRRRHAFYFYDPAFAFAPPPPVPIFFLPAPLPRLYFPPPPRPMYAYMLPVPAFVPMATYVKPAPRVVLPPDNFLAGRIHEHHEGFNGVVQPAIQQPGRTNGNGAAAVAVGVAAGAVLGAAIARVALPPAVSQKAVLLPPNAPKGAPKGPSPRGSIGAALPGVPNGTPQGNAGGVPKSIALPSNPPVPALSKGAQPSILNPQKNVAPVIPQRNVQQPNVQQKAAVPQAKDVPPVQTVPPPLTKGPPVNVDAAAAARRTEEAVRQAREREAQAARAAAVAKAQAGEAAAAARARAAQQEQAARAAAAAKAQAGEAAAAARARAAQQEQAARAAAQRNAAQQQEQAAKAAAQRNAAQQQQQQQQHQARPQQNNPPPKKQDCGHPGQPACKPPQ